jgi:hypothetical protein
MTFLTLDKAEVTVELALLPSALAAAMPDMFEREDEAGKEESLAGSSFALRAILLLLLLPGILE